MSDTVQYQNVFQRQDGFDGASTSYRLEQKGLLGGDADSIAARELKILWQRSHHALRNNGIAISARNKLVANLVGSGIIAKWDNQKMQKAWDEFIADPNLDGYGTIVNTQETWANALVESGDVLTRMVIQKGKGKIPLKLQPIEAEQLDPLYSDTTKKIKYGIQFKDSRPVTYYFFKRHPLSYSFLSQEINKRIPVPSTEVLHGFLRTRPGQWRGIPLLSAVLLPLYEIDELMDATLVRQKAAQAMGWIVTKKKSGALPMMGTIQNGVVPQEMDEDGAPVSKQIQKILPGGVHYLEEDEEFTFAETQDIGSNLVVMLEQQLRIIASALNLTFEQLTGDISKVNYSSIRAGMVEFRKRASMIQQLVLINLMLKPLANKFQELAGVFVSGKMLEAKVRWIMPKIEGADPLKDAQSDVLEIRAGLSTLEEKLAERGKDFTATLIQLALEQDIDLILDSNPKHNTQDTTQVKEEGEEGETTPSKEKEKPPKGKAKEKPTTSKKGTD